MRGKQERHLDLKTCDRSLMVAVKHAGACHCGIEPSGDDPTLYDSALRMPLNRMAMTFLGIPLHDDPMQRLIIRDQPSIQEIPGRWAPCFDLLDDIFVVHDF